MTTHRLEASAATTVDVFSRDHVPALTLESGDTVVVSSLDASGYLARQTVPGEAQPRMFPEPRGHALTGPIAVRGARPGDVLAVSFDEIAPGDWGWTASAGADTPIFRRLGLADAERAWLLWELSASSGLARESRGFVRSMRPFLGVTGLAPAEPGEHSTVPPRAGVGGNIDCRELVAGSTLYLRVAVPDALLYLGDGHAAQGDGEVGGTAIECPMTTRVTLSLLHDRPVDGVHAETPAGLITFGFDADLSTASGDALEAMVGWLCALHRLDPATALALASSCVDLRVTQVANRTWGVHAVLPAGVLTRE